MRAARFLALLLFTATLQAFACPQGYESPEALVKRARLILELEVLSVTDAPAPPTNKEPMLLMEDDPKERKNAQATVNVVKCIKGRCLAKTFTLVGGPYDSCAPMYCYLKFKPGEHLVLVVEHELPAELKGVVVNWRCRVLWPDEHRIATLMDNAKQSWRRQVETYKSLAPEAFARALALSRTSAKKPGKELAAEPYPVLTCLLVLWSNPDELPPLPLPTRRTAALTSKGARRHLVSEADPFAGELVDGVYHTLQFPEKPSPPALADALESRLKDHPKEVVTFNKSLFERFLREVMYVPPTKAAQIMDSLDAKEAFGKTVFIPFNCELGAKRDEKPELASLKYAMELANDEPDALVWSTFGLHVGRAQGVPLDPTYIAGYVERNPQRDYSFWPRLIVLLSAPDTRTSPIVETYLGREGNYYRLSDYLEFFLVLRQYPQAAKVFGRMETLVQDEAKATTTGEAKQQLQTSVQERVKDFATLLQRHHCEDPELLAGFHKLEKGLSSL